jgi:hypothetical protein
MLSTRTSPLWIGADTASEGNMLYRVTKVYVVEANDRCEAQQRIAAEDRAYLQIVSVQAVEPRGTGAAAQTQPPNPPRSPRGVNA